MSQTKKVVLAYSGGLDTTVILHWLAQQGFEVHALLLQIGQQVDDLEAIGQRAKRNGAADYVVIDARDELLNTFFLPCLHAHAQYEGRYLMGTSIARPLIAKHQVAVAQKIGAKYLAHGATGKGNDQVRFELTYQALDPSLSILPVWRNQEFIETFPEGRKSMLAYAAKHKLEVKASASKPWSTDDNLLHISYEAGILEDPWLGAPPEIFERMVHPQQAPDKVSRYIIAWQKGVPVEVFDVVTKTENRGGLDVSTYDKGKSLAKGLFEVYNFIDQQAATNGIGALGMVESRYVGMKSRGEYQAPGHTVLMASHRDLEGICLTGSQISEKLRRMHDFASLVYAGYWYDPVATSHRAFIASTQDAVTGESRVALYKGNVIVEGRRSPHSLYDAAIATMDGDGNSYSQLDASGFIRLHALPLRTHTKTQGSPVL